VAAITQTFNADLHHQQLTPARAAVTCAVVRTRGTLQMIDSDERELEASV
jgi:hypothetical protein